MKISRTALLPVGNLLFMALCRVSPSFSALWLRGFIRPVSKLASSISARVPFPLLEVFLLIFIFCASAALLKNLIRCVHLRCMRPLRRTAAGLIRTAAALLTVFVLLWYPACFAAPLPARSVSAEQAEALCRSLIRQLNNADLRFSPVETALGKAVAAASAETGIRIPEGAVKIARYPEWMDFFGLSGLYSPWTAEAIVHPLLAPGMRIFTAVHELMHLTGVADEGLANIRAWEACMRAGGEAAVSANLSALRYAMQALKAADSARWQACVAEMTPLLRNAFSDAGGFSAGDVPPSPSLNALLSLTGLLASSTDYDALVPHAAVAFSPAD